MMLLIAMHIPSWFFGAMLSDPTERERSNDDIPLWTLGIAGATGACRKSNPDIWVV
jgi:hypothetical protein